jgi:branched-chain amino acid transport system substrate-binding protein
MALDDSAEPGKAVRAAQKLLVDPAIVAVVGPFTPATVAATQSVLGGPSRPWIVPLTVDPAGGFASPQSSAWLTELLHAAQLEQGHNRILIVDAPAGMADEWVGDAGGVRVEERAGSTLLTDEIMPGDGVVWLGDAAQGAAWLKRQHMAGRFPAFWLANPVGGDVLAAHLAAENASGTSVSPAARWLVWGHSDYNQQLASRAPDLPIAQLTYKATCTALDQAFGVTTTPPRTSSLSWEVQHRDLGAAIESAP